MKLVEYIKNSYLTIPEQKENYLFGEILVHIRKPLSKGVSVTAALKEIERMLPKEYFAGLESIIVDELDTGPNFPYNAIYKNNIIYVSSQQDNVLDMVDDIIHELGHHCEKRYSEILYSDGKIEDEFRKKRERLFIDLKSYNMKPINKLTKTIKYNQDVDYYMYKTIGYKKLFNFINGLFLTNYSAVSIREYFGIGFEYYVMEKDGIDKKNIKKICPQLYAKLKILEKKIMRGK
tara:strand:+ start:14 stop:715 length:702 start_codon:yes stop_codon:yes gene_type:complete